MKAIVYLLFFSVSFASFAQVEFSKKNVKIAPKKIAAKPQQKPEEPLNEADPFAEKPIEIKKTTPEVATKDETPEISMVVKESEFINPGDAIMQKLEKELNKALVKEGLQEDDRLLVKIDLNFAEIRTKSEYFLIKFRDYSAIDGDLIRPKFNGIVIEDSIMLDYGYNQFKIYFKEGFNNLVITALNKGTSGGNTGQFIIYDAEGKLILTDVWDNLDAGVSSNFLIVKE